MTGYVVSNSLRMIRRHWKRHLSFALQMAAGVAVIYACATLYLSAAAQYREMREEISGAVWDVRASAERPAIRPPLDYGQYARLKERFPEASLPFCIARLVYYTEDGTDIRTGYVLYVSDDFLETVLGADKPGFERGTAAYAGNDIRGLLDGRYRLIPVNGHPEPEPIAAGATAAMDGAWLSILAMDELGVERTRFTHHHLENVPLDRTALLPLTSYYPSFRPEDAGMFLLSVRFGRDADEDEAIGDVLALLGLLTEWNGADYLFNVETPGQQLLLTYEQVRTGTAVAAAIAGICLAIVLIGLTAVAQLAFLRRRQAFAVCSALGARKAVLFGEMLLESALPSIAGGIAGTAASACWLSEWVDSLPVRQSPAVMAAAAALALAPGLLAACALAPGFRRLRPLEILRSDRV